MDTPASRGEPGPSPVDAFVFDFVTSLQGPFTSADLVRGALERGIALPGSVGKAAADGTYPKLERMLLTSIEWQHLAFSRGTDELTPRAWFFRGAKFLVSPIAEELAEGILIPGHRFEPFRGEHVPQAGAHAPHQHRVAASCLLPRDR